MSTPIDLECPEYLRDLIPTSERTALLLNISYISMINSPTLLEELKSIVTETWNAFSSSNDLLQKSVNTSDNLVKTLFPKLKAAAEKADAITAIKQLEEARRWIKDIIKRTDAITDEFAKVTHGIGNTTSHVNKVIQKNELTAMKSLALRRLRQNIQRYPAPLARIVKEVDDEVTLDIEDSMAALTRTGRKSGKQREALSKISKVELADFEESPIDKDLARLILKFTVLEMALKIGLIGDPVFLPEIKLYLTMVQEILLKLRTFWLKVEVLMADLQQKTFAAEDFIDYLEDFKDLFIENIDMSSKAWSKFSGGCSKVSKIFGEKIDELFKFVETDPRSLNPQERREQYEDLKAHLMELDST